MVRPASAAKETIMGIKSDTLARQFEAKVNDASAIIEKLSDAEWKKTTAGEKWTVAVVAHHVASSHEGIADIIKTVAAGRAMPNFTLEMLHEGNAKHAREHASATKAETLALHKKGAAAAAAVVRGLGDDQLGKSAVVLQGMPPMSVEQIITGILINHVDEHISSIRTAVGR
jgi:hypothetical protein